MNAHEAHRKAIESQYAGKCTVVEMQPIKDPATNITSSKEVTVLTDQPCNIAYKSAEATTIVGGVAVQNQTIKLFISPDVTIKAGSKITVTKNGKTTAYKRSGLPAFYPSHQEINLIIFDKYA